MLTHELAKPENPGRVVVLGGRGFIGRALLAILEGAGTPVLAPGSADLDLAVDESGEHLAGMLRDTDAVVVLAALTPDKGRGRGPLMRNLAMVANLCAALEKTPVAHVVYFSSDAVYPADAAHLTEASCAQPADLYGVMHLAREIMLRTSTRTPLAVVRSTLVYGAGDTHNSYGPNRFRRMAHKEGRITLFGEGEEQRDHMFVDDVAALAWQVLRHRSRGTLNAATGHSVSYAELAHRVAALFDEPIEIVGTARQNPITHRHFDVSALRKAFPTFRFTALEQGLAKAHGEMLKSE